MRTVNRVQSVIAFACLLLIVAFASTAFALPQLLGWEGNSGWSGFGSGLTLETEKGEKVTCTNSASNGSQGSDTSGIVFFKFEGCKSSSFACNTFGNFSGEVEMKGGYSYVFAALGSELSVAILFELEETTIKCTALVTLHVRGTFLCPVSSPLTSSTAHTYSCGQIRGVPANTLYWDDEGLEHQARQETQKNGGTFVRSGVSISDGLTFGTAVAFMNE